MNDSTIELRRRLRAICQVVGIDGPELTALTSAHGIVWRATYDAAPDGDLDLFAPGRLYTLEELQLIIDALHGLLFGDGRPPEVRALYTQAVVDQDTTGPSQGTRGTLKRTLGKRSYNPFVRVTPGDLAQGVDK